MKKIYLFLLLILCTTLTIAQNNDFNNGAADGGLWSSSTNWSTGIIPGATSIVRTNNGATSFVDQNFTILRLQNLAGSAGDRIVNSSNGAVLTIDVDSNTNTAIAMQNVSSSAVKLISRGRIEIKNTFSGAFSRFTNGNNVGNAIEFESTAILTLTTPLEIFKTNNANGSNNFFFNGTINGAANLRIAANSTATFGSTGTNPAYTGSIVFLATSSVIVNTADNTTFYNGPKLQVNGNSSIDLNGANVLASGITIDGSSNTFNFNVNKNQNALTKVVFNGPNTLNMAINNVVTNVTFEDNSASSWDAGAILNITGFKDGVIRFGTDSNGLTSTQLSQITVDDSSNGLALDSNGYLYSYDTSWTGASSSEWTTAGNWSNGVPTSGQDVFIADVATAPIIGGSTNVILGDLIIAETDGLSINAGGSLIVNGASSGNVTYNRTLTTVAGNENGWHLIASPVVGQAYNNTYATANNLATSGSKRGLATYNDANGVGLKYTYLEDDDSNAGTFTSGIGYSAKRASSGTVSFTGTLNTADVNGVTVSTAGNGFNLLGVPYTSYISSQTFLDNNSNLDQTQIWVWKQGVTGGNFIVSTAKADNFILSPGQGFFVKATSGTTVNFAESNQTANADTFQKSSRTEVQLLMNDGESNRFAKFYYLNNVTKGFDAGYEGEVFGGIKNSFEVFSQLVEDNQGKNYQVQSLPVSEMESTTVPLGLTATSGKEITFSSESLNLPSGIKVFLEDRLTNTFTRLDQANTSYKVVLNENLEGIGRFYLHTSSSALSTDTFNAENISIYSTNKSTLRIVGLSQGKSSVKLFNILGKQVVNTSFNSNGVYDMKLPELSTGVYIVQLETEEGKLNKKIVLE